MTPANISEMVLLIKRSIAFADWAAGEGICPVGYGDPEAVSRNPDEFLFAYSQATGDEDWHSLSDRITGAFEAKFSEIAKLREALSKAANQLTAVHDDAFKQAGGHGLVTTDGRGFSCLQLNQCDAAASEARAALAGGAA